MMSTPFPISAPFPATRMRRLRQADWSRRLVRESRLDADDLIWAVIIHDDGVPSPRALDGAIPASCWLTPEQSADAALQARDLGVPALALFPHVADRDKDESGSLATDADGLIPRAVRAIKAAVPDIGVICDVALDPYTSHGHDGLLDAQGHVRNDATVTHLVAQGLVCAGAGADILAPSDMMDGRVAALRSALEAEGRSQTMILSYAAKYASSLYGPYRDAIGSARLSGDKKSYQMSYWNSEEAMREIALDIAEGADLVMVKPGLAYLDIVEKAAQRFALPVLAFQVSGECAQIRAAAQAGWIDEDAVILETLSAFKRAGARAVVTYLALRAASLLAGAS